jgi:hypothetical protein
VAQCGRERVQVYKRLTPSGNPAYMLVDCTSGKRQFRCYSDPTKATEEADRLAKLLSRRSVVAASMSETQAIEYAASVMALANTGLSVQAACRHFAEWVKTVGNVQSFRCRGANKSSQRSIKSSQLCANKSSQLRDRGAPWLAVPEWGSADMSRPAEL